MRKLAILLALIASVGAGRASTTSDAHATESDRPNVILVMADDLGWGDTAYNGHPVLKTPSLDAMAAAGLRCERFYAAAPVCSPTRGSCLTGRHPFRYGVFSANSGHMREQEITLAEILREQGYATGHFGKWHLGVFTKTERDANRGGPRGAEHFARPSEHGFDVYFSTESKVPTWDPLLRPRAVNRGTWWAPVDDPSDAVDYGTAYWSDGKRVTENVRGDDSRVIVDRALPFIENAVAKKKPFFALVWFHAPHLPVVAGEKYAALYAEQDDYTKSYYGCITALDEQVGRLRGALRELGVADNTLLCFCSDNGPEGQANSAPGSAGMLRGRKRDLFEGGVRVPGIIEWPARIEAGRTTNMPICTSDYFPTVLDALQLPMSDDRPLDGVSLLPLFAGEEQRPRPIAFESAGQLALIDNQYKIIHRPAMRQRRNQGAEVPVAEMPFMLFDLLDDPAESRDLAGEHPQVVAKMTAQLAAWRQSQQASLAGKDYR